MVSWRSWLSLAVPRGGLVPRRHHAGTKLSRSPIAPRWLPGIALAVAVRCPPAQRRRRAGVYNASILLPMPYSLPYLLVCHESGTRRKGLVNGLQSAPSRRGCSWRQSTSFPRHCYVKQHIGDGYFVRLVTPGMGTVLGPSRVRSKSTST